MKRSVLGILLLITSMAANAGNQEFIQFALKQAHSRGFMGCDAAIKSAFENAGGDDIRIDTAWFNETKSDSLRMTATWGDKGDSVFIDVGFRKQAGKCLMTQVSVLTSPKSCTAFASTNKVFEFVAETADYIWMKSKGGVKMMLKPFGAGCVVSYKNSLSF